MSFDLKKSVQEYTDLTIFGTPKSDISEREGMAVGILRDVLTQSPEVQQAFNQAVCQQTDRVFHGSDYWLGGQTVKSVRSAILYNSQADCSNSQQNRQLTVDLLNPQFSKISFAGQYVSSPELEEFKNLYVTGAFKLADDLSYVLDALPDFRTNGSKSRVVLTSLIPAKWLAYIGLFGGAFSFGFGTAKVNQAIQELNHIQDEKQRKEAIRDLARGSSTMLLSLVSLLGASRNFDWSAGKNVIRLPTAASKAPEQPNRAVLPGDKIAPIRSKPSPTFLNQKPANDNSLPIAANDNGYCIGNPPVPSGSPLTIGSRPATGQSFSNPPVQSLGTSAAVGGRVSMSSAASQKAEEMCEGAKYSFNGNAVLALKPTPVQTIPIPVSTAPGQCGNGAALPANSPLIFSDYNGEHVSHASLINLKGVEEYLTHLILSFPAVLAVMMSGDSGVNNDPNFSGEGSEESSEIVLQKETNEILHEMSLAVTKHESFPSAVLRHKITPIPPDLNPAKVVAIAFKIFQEEEYTSPGFDKKSCSLALLVYLLPRLSEVERVKFSSVLLDIIKNTDPKNISRKSYESIAQKNIMAGVKDSDLTKDVLMADWKQLLSFIDPKSSDLSNILRDLIFSTADPTSPYWKSDEEAKFYIQLLTPVWEINYQHNPHDLEADIARYSMALAYETNLTPQARIYFQLLLSKLLNYVNPDKAATIVIRFIRSEDVQLADRTFNCIKPLLTYLSPSHKVVLLNFLINDYGLENSPLELIQALMSGVSKEEFSRSLQSMTTTSRLAHRNVDDLYTLLNNWDEYSNLQSGGN